MKRTSITEAKNSFSALIDGLKGGSSVLIMDRGEAPIRVEASAAQVAAMHARITDILSETTGPALVSNETLSSRREHLGH